MEPLLHCWLMKVTRRLNFDAAQESELLTAIVEAERGELIITSQLLGKFGGHEGALTVRIVSSAARSIGEVDAWRTESSTKAPYAFVDDLESSLWVFSLKKSRP